jgi:peptidoglycan-associated lipoprotein
VTKKIILFALIVLALAVVFNACKKTPEIPPPPPEPEPETTVVEEEPPPPPPPPPPLELQKIHFDYDKYTLTPDAQDILADNARGLLKDDYKTVTIRIEGHCDERGSDEYNMALGEKRAATARDYLVNYGVDANRISIISYGESRPIALGHDEAAWRQNRRDEFVKISE